MGALPDWCEPLLDSAQMRAVDRWAIEEGGVASLDLMERAGEGVAQAVERLAPDGPVVVACGKGNNGGDGLVAARLLRRAGREVAVVAVSSLDELSPDARANLERLPGPPPVSLRKPAARESLGRASVVVDALLGTGFSGVPQGAVAQAIEAVNEARGASAGGAGQGGLGALGALAGRTGAACAVVSVDVPSGVDASTGVVAGEAVRADLTVTFHAAKPGLWIHPGKGHAGRTSVIDIGVPRGAPGDPEVGLIGAGVLDRLPRRSAQSTKFTSGHVVVAGGSPGLMGAPAMAALAAMRMGAGYVTACVPSSLAGILDIQLMEVMTRSLPDERGSLTSEGLEVALEALARADALALGPGLGRDECAVSFARELARRSPVATVIDADGLNAHTGHLADLAGRDAPTVLTPHAGELARLLEIDGERVGHERLAHARAAAEQAGAVVVLKGDDTLIADPGGRVAVSRGDSPALATAGTGDALTGAIAALLAGGLDPFTAAAAGVYVHSEAGREAARAVGAAEGVIASDVIAALPPARERASGPTEGPE